MPMIVTLDYWKVKSDYRIYKSIKFFRQGQLFVSLSNILNRTGMENQQLQRTMPTTRSKYNHYVTSKRISKRLCGTVVKYRIFFYTIKMVDGHSLFFTMTKYYEFLSIVFLDNCNPER